MNSILGRAKLVAAAIGGLTLVACDSIQNVKEDDYSQLPTPSVVLRGAVTGLTSSPVELTANYTATANYKGTAPVGNIVRAVAQDGPVSFAAIPQGATYTVAVTNLPIGKLCEVANGSGTAQSNVTNVSVTCSPDPDAPTYTVSGTVVGLAGNAAGLQLKLTSLAGEETVSVPAGGTSFEFSSELLTDFDYEVEIQAAPTTPDAFGGPPVVNNCTVNAAGSGAIVDTDITDIEVACGFRIGGNVTVSGAPGTPLGTGGVTLALSNSFGAVLESLSLTNTGAYQFVNRQPATASATYAVSISASPDGQACLVGNAGNAALTANPPADLTTVSVTCAALPEAANQLVGTYKVDRNYLTFFANGTYIYAVHSATAGASGVEQGFYSFNCCGPGGSLLTPITTDSNGAANGLSQYIDSTFLWVFANIVKSGDSLSLTINPFSTPVSLNLTAVDSVADQLTGAWVSPDGRRVFVYDGTDGTGFHAGVNGAANVQDVCLTVADPTAAAGQYTQNRDTCTIPGGLTFVDVGDPGGFGMPGAPFFGSTFPADFAVTGDSLTLTYFGAPTSWVRSLPN